MNKKKIKRDRVENWILSNKRFLKIKPIERKLRLPVNTIQKFTNGKGVITDKQITVIYKFLTKTLFGNDIDWLNKNYEYLNIRSIEREISCKKGTLQKLIKYDRKVNEMTLKVLENWQNDLLAPIEQWVSRNNN